MTGSWPRRQANAGKDDVDERRGCSAGHFWSVRLSVYRESRESRVCSRHGGLNGRRNL